MISYLIRTWIGFIWCWFLTDLMGLPILQHILLAGALPIIPMTLVDIRMELTKLNASKSGDLS